MTYLFRSLTLALTIALSATVFAAGSVQPAGTITIYNFVTGDEATINPAVLRAEEGRDYLPQMPEAQEIYGHYLAQGHKPIVALMKSYREIMAALQAQQEAQGDTDE